MATIVLSRDEYLSAVSLHQKLTPRKALAWSALAVVSFCLGCWYLPDGVFLPGALVGAALGGTVGYWFQRYLYVPWRARRTFDQQSSLN